MDAKTLELLQAIAGDGDLARQYPQYREAALDVLAAAPQIDGDTLRLMCEQSPSQCFN